MNGTITLPRSVVEQAISTIVELEYSNSTAVSDKMARDSKAALRAALVQPQGEQDPVAWIERWYGSGPERGWWIVCGRDHIAHLGPAEMSGEAASKIVSAHNTSPPAQRHPLTDEQIGEIEGWFSNEFGLEAKHSIDFARAIERVHGIGGEV